MTPKETLLDFLNEYRKELLSDLQGEDDNFYSYTKTGELVAVVNILQWLSENE